ncbi:MAG: hypothetical protein PSN34_08865 [Urechidicola sp.]|nr:hypothetical protein [Urechidicola sp.]
MGASSQTTDWVFGDDWISPSNGDFWTSAFNLTKIYNPTTNKQIDFEYVSLYNMNDYWLERGAFKVDGSISQKTKQRMSTRSKRLEKIVFDQGTVEFFYDFKRTDLTFDEDEININENALTRILVKNTQGQIIKDVRLEYSNVPSEEGCMEPVCNRLFLDKVYFVSTDGGIKIPGYDFTYNTTKLPKRFSYKQDFLGFSNGAIANPEPTIGGHYIPKTYHYPEQGADSFLPIDIGISSYQELNGNYSLAANENYSKAGLLEKYSLPSGGYITLTSESNEFNYLGKIIKGAGLRVKKQEIFEEDGSLERSINYEYIKEDGTPSGYITYMPRFNGYKIVSAYQGDEDWGLRIHQRDMANQKVTQSSYVGYARVKVSETGNGYTVKEFTSPNDYPNVLGSTSIIIPPGNSAAQYDLPLIVIGEAIENGCFPNAVTDMDLVRGVPKTIKTFNQGNDLLKKIDYTYELKQFDSYSDGGSMMYADQNSDGCDPHAWFGDSATNKIARYETVKTEETNYLNSEAHTVRTSYTYGGEEYPFIKTKSILNSDNDTYGVEYFYPLDPEYQFTSTSITKFLCSSFEFLDDLVLQNRIASPIAINKSKNNDLTSNSVVVYKKFPALYDASGVPIGSGNISESPFLEKEIVDKTALLDPLPEDATYDPLGPLIQDACELESENLKYLVHRYDQNGNPIEVSKDKYSSHTVLI